MNPLSVCVAQEHSMPALTLLQDPFGSACPPTGTTGSAASYQMGLEDFPHSKWSYAAAPGLALGPAKLIRASESGRSEPHEVPWPECALDFVLQMNKATGQDKDIAGMNFVCQIPVMVFASPFFFFHHS